MMTLDNRKVHWLRWATLSLLFGAIVVASPSCSNRAEFVCEYLKDCELLEHGVARCIESIGIGFDSKLLDEGEMGSCLDCIVEHPCSEIDTICRQEACGDVLEAIEAAREPMGGEAGQGGEGGAP